jgi:hypothetical protein
MAEIKFCGRYMGGTICDGVLLDVSRAAGSGGNV